MLKVVDPERPSGLVVSEDVNFGLVRTDGLLLVLELLLVLLDALQDLLRFPPLLGVYHHCVLDDLPEDRVHFHERTLVILVVHDVVHLVRVVPLEHRLQRHHLIEDDS